MPTLFLEAFGQLSGQPAIDAQEEDLHSVFRERAELMGWTSTSQDHSSLLWDMNEAELNPDFDPEPTCAELAFDPNCIGFAQVGLDVGPAEPVDPPPPQPRSGRSDWYGYAPLPYRRRSTDPVLALTPLVQCFHDSLSRFGIVEMSALQVTASYLETGTASQRGYLVSVLNWFNTNLKASADAIVSFDHGLLRDDDVPGLLASLQYWNTGSFDFKSVVNVPDGCMVEVTFGERFDPVFPKSDIGVLVSMPEWTPSAAGWVLASVVDAARDIEPDASDFAVRVTRV